VKNQDLVSRRKFVSGIASGTAALQAGAAASTAKQEPAKRGKAAPAEYPRKFSGVHLQRIAFPLGGVGAGSISLGGRGQLRDWEIFNKPDKGNVMKYCFPSIFVQTGDQKPVVRVLEARIQPPYDGASGLGSQNAPGLPRLESCTFTGDYPLARIDFQDSDFPVSVSLEAFTPFIPLDADESGLPVAVLRYRVSNHAKTKATVSIAYSIDNPVGGTGRMNDYRGGALPGLFMRNPFLAASDAFAGSFALAVVGQGAGKVSYLRGWSQQRWAWTGALLFWDDFSADGELGPEAAVRDTTGSLCLKREIEAGAEADYTFLLSWHFPNRTPERCGWTAV